MRLFHELVASWSGAAIVIGGGPSAPSDFEIASRAYPDALHISANQHGFVLPGARPRYAVHIDKIHQHYKEPMEQLLKRMGKGAKLIGRFDWDDYYLVDWRYGGDTGVMALLVAQMMGAAPVIPCGFDRWIGKRPGQMVDYYFHNMGGRDKKWPGPPAAPNLKRLVEVAGSGTIRPVSGPMLEWFPKLGVPAKPNLTPLGEHQKCQTSTRPKSRAPAMPTDHVHHRCQVRERAVRW